MEGAKREEKEAILLELDAQVPTCTNTSMNNELLLWR
jgi:hypothetical protein